MGQVIGRRSYFALRLNQFSKMTSAPRGRRRGGDAGRDGLKKTKVANDAFADHCHAEKIWPAMKAEEEFMKTDHQMIGDPLGRRGLRRHPQ